jgi:hypothetical protein
MKKSVLFLAFCGFLVFSETVFSQITTKQELKSAANKSMLQKTAEQLKTDVTSVKVDSIPLESNNKSINNINSSMPNRISMNVTVPKQTQGATFGEKVNAGLHAAGSALSQGASVTISGNLWFDKIEFPNMVNSVSSVGNLAGGVGGGAAAASYAATGRIGNLTDEKASGISAVFFAREAGSGMATGKRQYQPIYISKNNISCEACIATLKKSETVYNWDIKKNQMAKNTNPYYVNNELQGEMPQKRVENKDNDCDGVPEITLILINTITRQEVAKTTTGKCGNFSFPNIPNGTYTLQLTGNFLTKKGYDYYMAKAVDFKGKVQLNEETFKLVLTSIEEVPTDNSLIKTKTKSNQSNDKIAQNNAETFVVKMDNSYADVDNDGAVDLIVGGSLPGGAVISSALNARPGNPIGGLSIKGGKNPGGNMLSKTTNNQGEFEFLNLEPGNYQFTIEQTVFIKSEVQIELTSKTKHDTIKNSIQNIR